MEEGGGAVRRQSRSAFGPLLVSGPPPSPCLPGTSPPPTPAAGTVPFCVDKLTFMSSLGTDQNGL